MITKEEARRTFDAGELAAMAALEVQCDAALKKYNGYQVTVSPSGSDRVIQAIAEKYRAVGWTVTIGDNQRDGPWMAFS